MARLVPFTLDVPLSVAQGANRNVDDFTKLGVYVTGTFVATLQIQVSGDETNYHNEGSAFTAPGKLEITIPAKGMRVDVTAYTSGTPVITVIGVA